MNKVELIGRLCGDPEVNSYGKGKNETVVAKYRLAVERPGVDEADFITCTTFNKGAEFVEKYLEKGMKIAIVGSLKSGSYENKEGITIYTTEVIVQEHYFCEKKEDRKRK